MIRASIDLGTNTCLLLVAEMRADGKEIQKVLRDEATIVRLGQGVDHARMLQPEPMKRVLDCLKRYAEIVQSLGIHASQVKGVATSQARDAKNSAEFFDRIQKETGFSFQTLSGNQEARSTFLGSIPSEMNPDQAVVVDIGGGSTELMTLKDEVSLDIGSVRFTERYLKSDPVTDEEFWACQEGVDTAIRPLKFCGQLVAVAGTATTLAAWHLGLEKFDSAKVDGTLLTRGDIHRMVEELKWRTAGERRKLPCMEPMRSDVILAGALILWRIMEVLDFPHCRVSTRGLRYGVLLNLPSTPGLKAGV